jgi:flagellar protein FliS
MYGHNPHAQYRQTAIETASKTRMVVMLFDGAIRFLNQALPAMQAQNYDVQTHYIGKAQAIISHLFFTLDHEAGGDVAQALKTFYITSYDSLTGANIKNDALKLQRVISGLREVREAWIEVDHQIQAGKPTRQLIAA